MTLLKASHISLTFLCLLGCVGSQVDLAGEIICRAADGSLCPKLSHFKSQLSLNPLERIKLWLAYDPNQSRKASWFDRLDPQQQTLAPARSWLADYGAKFELSPRWSLHIEDSSGTTLLPNASYLAFAQKLQDVGWQQTVGRLTFENPDIFVGTMVVGLGEGERLAQDDGDLFYGACFKWYWQKALALQLGYSQDPNSLPEDAVWWLADRSDRHKGFHSQRLALSLSLNGKYPSLRGLEASVGWQRNLITNARRQAFAQTPLWFAFDPTEMLSQNLGGSGATKREAWLMSGSYRILSEYLLAFHTGLFRGAIADGSLSSCGLSAAGDCVDEAETSQALSLREWSYGLGKIDNDGWSVLLESHEERYDRLYQNYHFIKNRGARQKSMQGVQARINWNW